MLVAETKLTDDSGVFALSSAANTIAGAAVAASAAALDVDALQNTHPIYAPVRSGDEAAEIEELRAKVLELKLEESAQKELLRECDRLERMPASSSEGGQIRTWVESVVEQQSVT